MKNHNGSDLSGDIMKLIVSKTLNKYGVNKKSMSPEDRERVRDLVHRLKEQTDAFLNQHNRAGSGSDGKGSHHTPEIEEQHHMHKYDNDVNLVWKPGFSRKHKK
ncbi:hypothetical protein [Bacillus sp. EB01]|uniref:hypothetical protein n=1 Tax=Bacillus sp. EB01 TaxID=1347086 RepID=UPI0005C69BEF|nr:hypothetical protein [Bacillus sp. EB01]